MRLNETRKEQEAGKWAEEEKGRKSGEVRLLQDQAETGRVRQAQDTAKRADEAQKAEIMRRKQEAEKRHEEARKKQAEDERVREDRRIAEGKRKAVVEAEAEQKGMQRKWQRRSGSGKAGGRAKTHTGGRASEGGLGAKGNSNNRGYHRWAIQKLF